MTRPRISIGWLMLAVALIGFHLAIVYSDQEAFGLDGLEVGLLPGVTVLAITLFSSCRHGKRVGPFARGFVASLAVAIVAYVVACLAIPDFVRWPIVYFVNYIEPYLFDADLPLYYRLSLEIQGLIVGLPPLLFALGGGLVTKAVAARAGTLSREADPPPRLIIPSSTP